MSCSNPIKLYEKDLKPSLKKNHSDFVKNNLQRSFNSFDYALIPCGYCLNCRIDKQNQLIDRAEYEYIHYGCGAFVTFTYDDIHNFKNAFIDCKDNKFKYSINKKDGKEFLDRLNKLVHQEFKKHGFNPLCRTDYKYILTSEYGDKFNRNHFHALFFGLDFAFCERLFWRAWNFQGSIQVGPISNGGLAYAVKYISNMEFGIEKFVKYSYHHLEPPSSSHSLHFGEGLYLSQLDYIKKHDGCYKWHNRDIPLPTYYKNKYKIISDLDVKKYEKKYKTQCDNIKTLYNITIKNYHDLVDFNQQLNSIKEKNRLIKLRQAGKQVLDLNRIDNQYHFQKYKSDPLLTRIIDNQGTTVLKVGEKYTNKLTVRDLMYLKTDYKHLVRKYGYKITDQMFGLDPIPF